jgi:FMN-dependent NADH-azoreductase/putative sterol carrier protein
MKVLALNSSPRGAGQSKTEWMLEHLVTGMRKAGAEVEIVDLRKKKINYCAGCFTCWTKTPGKCLHKDDMTHELFPKFLQSDLVVYATPLYHYMVNAQMKTFIERTLPILQPFFKMTGEKTHHPLRHEPPKAVWLSVAGFPEESVFNELSRYVRFMFADRLLAEIYRPAAESLLSRGNEKIQADVAGALQRAGRELVVSGMVSEAAMAAIRQPVFESVEVLHEFGNMFWQTCIAEGVTPKEFENREMIPRPKTLKQFMLLLQAAFNPEAAQELQVVMQFKFSGAEQGNCFFAIADGTIQAEEGLHSRPDLTIASPFDTWMDIMTRKADGQEMFMQQKYTVQGDLNLLMKMGSLFVRGE